MTPFTYDDDCEHSLLIHDDNDVDLLALGRPEFNHHRAAGDDEGDDEGGDEVDDYEYYVDEGDDYELYVDDMQTPEMAQWTAADVGRWLARSGHPQLAQPFQQLGITGLDLLELGLDDLTELGVEPLSTKRSLLQAVNSLQLSHNSNRGHGSNDQSVVVPNPRGAVLKGEIYDLAIRGTCQPAPAPALEFNTRLYDLAAHCPVVGPTAVDGECQHYDPYDTRTVIGQLPTATVAWRERRRLERNSRSLERLNAARGQVGVYLDAAAPGCVASASSPPPPVPLRDRKHTGAPGSNLATAPPLLDVIVGSALGAMAAAATAPAIRMPDQSAYQVLEKDHDARRRSTLATASVQGAHKWDVTAVPTKSCLKSPNRQAPPAPGATSVTAPCSFTVGLVARRSPSRQRIQIFDSETGREVPLAEIEAHQVKANGGTVAA